MAAGVKVHTFSLFWILNWKPAEMPKYMVIAQCFFFSWRYNYLHSALVRWAVFQNEEAVGLYLKFNKPVIRWPCYYSTELQVDLLWLCQELSEWLKISLPGLTVKIRPTGINKPGKSKSKTLFKEFSLLMFPFSSQICVQNHVSTHLKLCFHLVSHYKILNITVCLGCCRSQKWCKHM